MDYAMRGKRSGCVHALYLFNPPYILFKRSQKLYKQMMHRNGKFFLGGIQFVHIPDYTAMVGSSKIKYHPIKLSKVPAWTFVSKYPIKNRQFFNQDIDIPYPNDFAKVTWEADHSSGEYW